VTIPVTSREKNRWSKEELENGKIDSTNPEPPNGKINPSSEQQMTMIAFYKTVPMSIGLSKS